MHKWCYRMDDKNIQINKNKKIINQIGDFFGYIIRFTHFTGLLQCTYLNIKINYFCMKVSVF